MKTIAVLTDFSERSEHAARYALHLAQKIGADILLFNAFLVPSDIAMVAAEVAHPIDYDENLLETGKALHQLKKKLENWSAAHQLPRCYSPKITAECQLGPIGHAISAIEKNKDIFLTVMGTHDADCLTTLMLGNTCRQLINGTRLPLMLIPAHARFKTPGKFAFATDLNVVDIACLSALTQMAKRFSAEIMITHVQTGNRNEHQHLEVFMNRVANEVDYAKITFTTLPGKTFKKGIEWLMQFNKPDVLVMMHHDKGLFDAILAGSQTQKVAAHTPLPLLIFTYSARHVLAF